MSENYGGLNLYRRDICLEKEEIDKWMEFQKNSIGNLLFAKSAKSYGVIKVGDSEDSFKVSAVTGATSFSIDGVSNSDNPILSGSYAIDENGKIIYLKNSYTHDMTNYSEGDYYVKISARTDYIESNSVNIDVNGNISGSNFQETLRGYSSGYPTYIKFYTKNTDGSYSIVDSAGENNSVYEVAEVSSDSSAILSGSFVAATNLYYAVLGAYALGSAIDQTESSGLYAYNSCSIELEEVNGGVSNNGTDFYLAQFTIDQYGIITELEDVREDISYYQFDTENLGYSERAKLDASNLTSANITSWLLSLDTYNKSQSQSLFAYLNGGSNITSPDTWINNLGLYNENKTGKFITSMANAGLTDSSFSSSSWTDNGELIRSTFGRQVRVDQFLSSNTESVNYYPNLIASLAASTLGTVFGLSGVGRLICELAPDKYSSSIFRYIPDDSHREFKCIIDESAGASTITGVWYEEVQKDKPNTGWLDCTLDSTYVSSGEVKAKQSNGVVYITGYFITASTNYVDGTPLITIPDTIDTPDVFVGCGILGYAESGRDGCYGINSGTRIILVKDEESWGSSSRRLAFSASYPVV